LVDDQGAAVVPVPSQEEVVRQTGRCQEGAGFGLERRVPGGHRLETTAARPGDHEFRTHLDRRRSEEQESALGVGIFRHEKSATNENVENVGVIEVHRVEAAVGHHRRPGRHQPSRIPPFDGFDEGGNQALGIDPARLGTPFGIEQIFQLHTTEEIDGVQEQDQLFGVGRRRDQVGASRLDPGCDAAQPLGQELPRRRIPTEIDGAVFGGRDGNEGFAVVDRCVAGNTSHDGAGASALLNDDDESGLCNDSSQCAHLGAFGGQSLTGIRKRGRSRNIGFQDFLKR